MTKGYRELVALQVTFNKDATSYKIEHFYRWTTGNETSPMLTLRTYDMSLIVSHETVLDGLLKTYAPAILSIWQQVGLDSTSELLQFQVGGSPDELNLQGDWTLWAEW